MMGPGQSPQPFNTFSKHASCRPFGTATTRKVTYARLTAHDADKMSSISPRGPNRGGALTRRRAPRLPSALMRRLGVYRMNLYDDNRSYSITTPTVQAVHSMATPLRRRQQEAI